MWGNQHRGVIPAFVMAGVLLMLAAASRASVLQFNYATTSSPNSAELQIAPDFLTSTLVLSTAASPTYVDFTARLDDNSAILLFNHVVLDVNATVDSADETFSATLPGNVSFPINDGFVTISTDDTPANAGNILRVDFTNASLFGYEDGSLPNPIFSSIDWNKFVGGAGYTLGSELLSQLPGPFTVGSQQQAVISLTNGIFGSSPEFIANSSFSGSVTEPAPEPASAALLLVGLGSLLILRRRKYV